MLVGGKNSTVLLHLVIQQAPNIPVIYNDTGVEFPETREFVEKTKQDWKLNLHIARPEPGVSFWDISERLGWPLLGKEQSDNIERGQKKLEAAIAWLESEAKACKPEQETSGNGFHPKNGGNGGNGRLTKEQIISLAGLDKLSDMELAMVGARVEISTRCCEYLKERPTKKLELELGADCKFLGIMASKSRRRALVWIDHGDYYYHKDYFKRTRGIWKASPLSIWMESDIWEYHEKNKLPHCKIYDMGHDRNGCWTCGMGVKFGQFEKLRKSHPKLFYYLMVKRSMGRELLKAKVAVSSNLDMELAETWAETVDIAALLLTRPCFFDTL